MTKPLIILALLFIPFFLKTAYSQNCDYKIGDLYDLKKIGVNLREQPFITSKIVTTINTSIDEISLEILEIKKENDFAKVMIKISSGESSSQILKLDGLIGWIHSSLIQNNVYYLLGDGVSEEEWEEKIEEFRLQKISKECIYSPELHSHALTQLAIKKYNNEVFFKAIEYLTESIKIPSNYEYKIRSYTYRAFAKQELGDYYGAIEDFNFAIANCPTTIGNDVLCDLCKNHKTDVEISGINYLQLCKENLITQKAICKANLKNYNEALTDLNTVINLNQNWGFAYYIRGQIKDILNDKAGCCKDLSKAGELGIEEAYKRIKERCNN